MIEKAAYKIAEDPWYKMMTKIPPVGLATSDAVKLKALFRSTNFTPERA
jgi:hypothetical protein